MATNTINTVKSLTGVAAKMGAVMLRNRLGFTASVDKEDESTFGQGFKSVQPGDTIYINKNARYNVRSNATFATQDTIEERVALTVNQRRGVDIDLTSAEIATDAQLRSWADRFLKPAVARIADSVEAYNLQLATQAAYMTVGTPGTSPATSGVFLQAAERIRAQSCPQDNLLAVIHQSVNTTMVPALQGLFLPTEQVAKQFRTGYLGSTTLGMDFMTSNLAYTHTNGTANAQSVLVNGAVSTNGATTIAVDAITGTNNLTAGTTFTIAGVFDVNPITKATLPNLKQFTVTATTAATAGAIAALPISPALFFSGPRQNVSATIADNAALTFSTGTGVVPLANSLVYHPSAVRFASVPLFDPGNGVVECSTETVDGISMRAIKFYDGDTDQLKMRLDIQFGTAVVRDEWLCRVTS
jgi:hypothetical protein